MIAESIAANVLSSPVSLLTIYVSQRRFKFNGNYSLQFQKQSWKHFQRHLGRCTLTRCLRDVTFQNLEEIDDFSKYSGYLFERRDSPAEFMDAYEPSVIASIYQTRPFLFLRRLLQIGLTFGRWFGLRYLDRLLGRSDTMFKERAMELRALLVQLGPAFVKIAQAVSSRPDVVSPAYLEELSLLQDRIAPFSTEVALQIVEDELGVPLDAIFSEITIQPIAAASLGQVYQARLRPGGKVVAVKVQRPGVRSAIALDIYIIRILAGYVRKAGKFNTNLQVEPFKYSLMAIVDEWASSLFREMDYEREAKNGIMFRKLYGKLPDVVAPKMYLDLSSRRVLVMEWIEGQKLSTVQDLHLVEVGVYCSLTQLLECGFYHADPHPGNLIRTYDGKLAYIDFGMMGDFKQELRDGFIEACLHLVNRDFEALADDFVTLGLIPPNSSMREISEALTGVFKDAVSKGVRNISFGDFSGNLGRTMYKYKFQIPSYFSLVIRSLAVLEGIALNSDPNYKVLGSSYPWIARKVLTDSSPQLRLALRSLLYKDGTFRIDRLESLIAESVRSPTNETLSRKEQKTDGNSKTAMKSILKFTLSEEGKFVRDILLEELVKGIDALNRVTLEKTASNALLGLPTPVPSGLHFVEDEDIKHLNTIRHLMLLLLQVLAEKPIHNFDDGGTLLDKDAGQITWDKAISILQQSNALANITPVLSAIFEVGH
eukprot:TRINITY_DN861_c0_g1_i2.p1 TRINITY_DN861_c0_g1~~TRINITY_DN861_c0_g1_i2.p1  ORF type:complete len:711 (+),score=112.46 TRINITY_DN861_c0_g1_i2:97-2229(+)